jgi:hypothetical protein
MANAKASRRVALQEAIAEAQETAADPESLETQIRNLAYQLWLARGCPAGSPEVDWQEAEERMKGPQTQTAAS